MIIRFGISNFLSIYGNQEFSLVASKLSDHPGGLIETPALRNDSLVPAAVVYGANASGKSNLVEAFRFFQQAVAFSHTTGTPDSKIPRIPFALSSSAEHEATIGYLDFVLDEIHYQYGFSAESKEFVGEWLYYYPHGKRQTLFERTGAREFKFGRNLRGRNAVIRDLTRPNSLFLSTAAQNDHEQLSRVYGFIRSIGFHSRVSVEAADATYIFEDDKFDERTIGFLKNIGTGIVGYRSNRRPISKDEKKILSAITSVISEITEEPGPKNEMPDERLEIELSHIDEYGKEIYFELKRESAGTRRLLVLMSRVYKSLDNGTALIVDEFDASLHTQVCESIIDLYLHKQTNPHGAQLIVTTHDTNLLNLENLRRDQIWLVEKSNDRETIIFPLTDINTHKNDNIERGYLQGRFGGVPNIYL